MFLLYRPRVLPLPLQVTAKLPIFYYTYIKSLRELPKWPVITIPIKCTSTVGWFLTSFSFQTHSDPFHTYSALADVTKTATTVTHNKNTVSIRILTEVSASSRNWKCPNNISGQKNWFVSIFQSELFESLLDQRSDYFLLLILTLCFSKRMFSDCFL